MLLISKVSLRSKNIEENYIIKKNSIVSTCNVPGLSIFSELSLYLNDCLVVNCTDLHLMNYLSCLVNFDDTAKKSYLRYSHGQKL